MLHGDNRMWELRASFQRVKIYYKEPGTKMSMDCIKVRLETREQFLQNPKGK